MIHRSGEIAVGKGDAAEWFSAQDLSRGWLSIQTKEKAWLGTEISVPPAVENDAGDISLRIKSVAGKHGGHLVADLPFIVAKPGAEHFRAAAIALLLGRESWIGI